MTPVRFELQDRARQRRDLGDQTAYATTFRKIRETAVVGVLAQ